MVQPLEFLLPCVEGGTLPASLRWVAQPRLCLPGNNNKEAELALPPVTILLASTDSSVIAEMREHGPFAVIEFGY